MQQLNGLSRMKVEESVRLLQEVEIAVTQAPDGSRLQPLRKPGAPYQGGEAKDLGTNRAPELTLHDEPVFSTALPARRRGHLLSQKLRSNTNMLHLYT